MKKYLLSLPVVLIALACGESVVTPTKTPGRMIDLAVSGPTTANITYRVDVDHAHDDNAVLPWAKQLTSSVTWLSVTITAHSKGTGPIYCKITVDGKIVKEDTATRQYAMAMCSWSG